MRGYDAHIIMQAIEKTDKKIKYIPNNIEKYMSFSMGSMDYNDSFEFLPASLGKRVSILKEFKHLQACFNRKSDAIATAKGGLPL